MVNIQEVEQTSGLSDSDYCEVDPTPPSRLRNTEGMVPRTRSGGGTRSKDGSQQREVSDAYPQHMRLRTVKGENLIPDASPEDQHSDIYSSRVEERLVPGRSSEALASAVSFTIAYVADIVSGAVDLIRKPLSFLLSLLVLAIAIKYVAPYTPICAAPWVSSSAFCGARKPELRADFPTLIQIQSKTVEELVGDSTSGSALALQLTKAEMATGDLVTLVRISDLKGRDLLGDKLNDFMKDASAAGEGLQDLNAKVLGAVDTLEGINDWSLRAIESSNSPGLLSALTAWRPSGLNNVMAITYAFNEAMNVQSKTLDRLIAEAEISQSRLEKLKARLAAIAEIAARENVTVSEDKDKLLGSLWTKLGRNRKNIKRYDSTLSLLGGLGKYTEEARNHIHAALITLRGMKAEMKEMRLRLAAPDIAGTLIPLEVHMASIKEGLRRLKKGKTIARQLEEDMVRKVLAT